MYLYVIFVCMLFMYVWCVLYVCRCVMCVRTLRIYVLICYISVRVCLYGKFFYAWMYAMYVCLCVDVIDVFYVLLCIRGMCYVFSLCTLVTLRLYVMCCMYVCCFIYVGYIVYACFVCMYVCCVCAYVYVGVCYVCM